MKTKMESECPEPTTPATPAPPQVASVAEEYAAYAVAEGVTINVYQAGGIVAGVMVAVGSLLAISTVTTEMEENNAMAVEGVFAISNADGLVFAQGASVGVDLTNQKAVVGGTGDITAAGVCWKDAAATDSHVLVKINA